MADRCYHKTRARRKPHQLHRTNTRRMVIYKPHNKKLVLLHEKISPFAGVSGERESRSMQPGGSGVTCKYTCGTTNTFARCPTTARACVTLAPKEATFRKDHSFKVDTRPYGRFKCGAFCSKFPIFRNQKNTENIFKKYSNLENPKKLERTGGSSKLLGRFGKNLKRSKHPLSEARLTAPQHLRINQANSTPRYPANPHHPQSSKLSTPEACGLQADQEVAPALGGGVIAFALFCSV